MELAELDLVPMTEMLDKLMDRQEDGIFVGRSPKGNLTWHWVGDYVQCRRLALEMIEIINENTEGIDDADTLE